MNEIPCPACAGPDNAQCATCSGASLVTQEVHDAFIVERNAFIATMELKRALQELPIENIPGVEQTAIVISTVENTITAEVDGNNLTWDEEAQTWV